MSHPLDPLSQPEIEDAVRIFTDSDHANGKAYFSSLALIEPEKPVMQQWQPGQPMPRRVRLLGMDSGTDGGFECDIDLERASVDSFTRLSEGQSPYGYYDVARAVRLTKEHPEWQQAMQRRGITDFELVQIDPWPGGGYPHHSIPKQHRAMRAISFLRMDKTDNGYARPIHGLIAHVDLTEGKVAYVEDSGVIDMPPNDGRFDAEHQASFRDDLKPIAIAQEDGASFEVEDYSVKWQGYEFNISMHPIHGLVIHQLSLRGRPILYRASLSDMVVPYGDKDSMHGWKHVLDASEFCMGRLVNSLKLGCDCLGEIHYFDLHQLNWDGKVRKIDNAICMHEEDYGIQWKHYDGESQRSEVRRSRRLVISAIHTIGNYDYGIYWYLYLDGTIQLEVKLTGIVGVSAVNEETFDPQFAPMIGENLASPVHQHLFCVRLDFELDGGTNSLYENQIEVCPISPENPDGTQFKNVSRLLRREEEAKRTIAPRFSRNWKVVNPDSKNSLGFPVGYKLLPGATPVLFAQENSRVAQRAEFSRFNLWATPFKEGEYGAAGDHTPMHKGGGGLPEFTRNNRGIEDCDLVLWHTFGLTHVPRPEDWPVMPVEYCGFHLIPSGFFDRNPTLDLPPHCHE
jgi:primary-amine oxidase